MENTPVKIALLLDGLLHNFPNQGRDIISDECIDSFSKFLTRVFTNNPGLKGKLLLKVDEAGKSIILESNLPTGYVVNRVFRRDGSQDLLYFKE